MKLSLQRNKYLNERKLNYLLHSHEREGVLGDWGNQYMKNIIAGAHKARYTVGEDDTKKQAINIS